MSTLPLDNPNPQCFPATFDATVLDGGGYTSADGCWNAYVNADVIEAWGLDDWLDRLTIVDRHSSSLRARFNRYKGMPAEPRTWADAGNLVHHALRLSLVAEETGPDGERGWRILDREPHWIVVGTGYHREARQVRGLPPAEQAVVDKAEARKRKLSATLDRKARHAADERIANRVRQILQYDPASLVPKHWARLGYVPAWLPGTRLDAAAAIVREAHHTVEMDRERLRGWLSYLGTESLCALSRPSRRQAERDALPEHAQLPDDDAAALGALA
ncbi:hypothetical protein LPC10_17470 [Methylorubrum sp. B1-46]|uniref:hypothetical protein n=1 Tax=Methylorubrum TaxID=2282523 RepID=UPI001E424BD3|nr:MULTISPECIES: hypothetical protein [Methylorubrum]MCG5246918.1 hypothetical protein [Methylorubrum extorquens]UGB24723.1 hypothetical protein LPC10_17470 [Methylorubrum sp. B1-46]